MARVNHQKLRFGWAAELKRLAASGDSKGLDELVDYIKEHVDQIGAFDQMWSGVITGAIQRALPVEITKGQALQLFRDQGGRCAISGELIAFRAAGSGVRSSFRTASLDRISSERGYVLGNVWWVHRDINRMKSDLPLDRFVELCRAVAANADTLQAARPAPTAWLPAAPISETSAVARVVCAFVQECCDDAPSHSEGAAALWAAFGSWRERIGCPTCSQTAFGRALRAIGYTNTHGRVIRWHGLRLKPAKGREGPIAPREGREAETASNRKRLAHS